MSVYRVETACATLSRDSLCWRHRLELCNGAEVKDGDRRDAASPPHLRAASRASGLAERPAPGGMRRPGAVDFVDEWGVRYLCTVGAFGASRAGGGGIAGEAAAAAAGRGGGVSDVSLLWHIVRIIALVRAEGPSSWFTEYYLVSAKVSFVSPNSGVKWPVKT